MMRISISNTYCNKGRKPWSAQAHALPGYVAVMQPWLQHVRRRYAGVMHNGR